MELLEEFDLTEAAKRPLKNFSGGMRRRLDLAASLIAQPPLLFLDEPTTGLDPRTRNQMWDTIRRLVNSGSTVLLTTQYLQEADELADRIAVIDHGRVVAEGTVNELKSSVGTSSLQLSIQDYKDIEIASRKVEEVLKVKSVVSPEGSRITAPMADADLVTDLLIAFRQSGIQLAELSVQKPTLDEVFLSITENSKDKHEPKLASQLESSGGMKKMKTTTMTQGTKRQLRNSTTLGQAIRNSLTMAYRGLLKIRRTPEQLFDVTLQPIIFTLMFTYIFGGAISGDIQSYLPVIIPGILVQTVITTSVVTGTQLREDMDKGVFDRFKSLPIARIAPLAGALLADTIRYTIATALTFSMGFLMGYRPEGGLGHVAIAALLVIVCAWAISWIFAFFGVIARTASSVQGISMIILFPLTFLSNAFVPADTMPNWLQWFVKINPISHLVTAVRDLANNGTVGWDLIASLIGAAVIVAVFAPITVRAYMRRT